jgi:hypothetical protein
MCIFMELLKDPVPCSGLCLAWPGHVSAAGWSLFRYLPTLPLNTALLHIHTKHTQDTTRTL